MNRLRYNFYVLSSLEKGTSRQIYCMVALRFEEMHCVSGAANREATLSTSSVFNSKVFPCSEDGIMSH